MDRMTEKIPHVLFAVTDTGFCRISDNNVIKKDRADQMVSTVFWLQTHFFDTGCTGVAKSYILNFGLHFNVTR